MLRSFIKAGEYLSRLIRYIGCFIILSCKLANSVKRVELYYRYKFHFSSDFAAKQSNVLEPAESQDQGKGLAIKTRVFFYIMGWRIKSVRFLLEQALTAHFGRKSLLWSRGKLANKIQPLATL